MSRGPRSAALEARGWLRREPSPEGRRAEALAHDQGLRERLGPAKFDALADVLRELVALGPDDPD